MDRNKMARLKAKGGFVKIDPREEKSIMIQKEELGKDPDEYEMIKNLIACMIRHKGHIGEVEDIAYTIKSMEQRDEQYWKANDQFISITTMQAKLDDAMFGLRSFEKKLTLLQRQAYEGYGIKPEEVEAHYNKIMGITAKKP
jgi:hypothetical protein